MAPCADVDTSSMNDPTADNMVSKETQMYLFWGKIQKKSENALYCQIHVGNKT